MIRNYLITTLRSFWRNRSHTVINILGLSLGITCAIVIFLIVRFELSYDAYHANRASIFRVVTEYKGAQVGYSSGTTYPLPEALRNDFAELKRVVLVDANLSDPVISVTQSNGGVDRFKETRVAIVDPEYFEMFDYQWIEGNHKALRSERSIVLTQSVAKKYFGNSNALHRTINFNNQFDVTVTGIVADPPLNTDLPFELLLSSKIGIEGRGWDEWGPTASSLQCFVQLNDAGSESALEAKLEGWHLRYFTGDLEQEGKRRTYTLQPLDDIHFNTNFYNFGNRKISRVTLLTLTLIGGVLLLTACVNFINLNTVLVANRSREAGVRKVMGSTRAQLVRMFLGETFIITVISLLFSIGLVELCTISLTPELGYQLTFNPFSDGGTMLFLAALPAVVAVISGLYPGLVLSRLQPVQALKNRIGGDQRRGLLLRRSLIVFQLVISQVLIVCTIIAVQQINHFMAHPTGIDSEGIVEFELPENEKHLVATLRERLLQIPGVMDAAMSNTGAAALSSWGGNGEVTLNNELREVNADVKIADHRYIATYGLKLLYGDGLVESDTATRFLVTEAFVRALGLTNAADAIGLPVEMWGNRAVITGIVKDFHSNSLHSRLRPTIIYCGSRHYQQGAVRISTDHLATAVPAIQDAWESVYPNYVFEHSFLDETIASFYDAERRSAYLIGVFAAVAIFIGCIGLFGLIAFMARARTKEVGIRKTLGASVGQIVALFSKEFAVLVAISLAIAVPVADKFMDGWLSNFQYKINPGILTFALGGAITLLIVLATVGLKSFKAAVANPMDSLRDE